MSTSGDLPQAINLLMTFPVARVAWGAASFWSTRQRHRFDESGAGRPGKISVPRTDRTTPAREAGRQSHPIRLHSRQPIPRVNRGALPSTAAKSSPNQLNSIERMKVQAPNSDQSRPSLNRGQTHPTAIRRTHRSVL